MSSNAPMIEYLAVLKDPRTGPAKRHNFLDIIVIAVCAVICGADSWVDVEMFGKSKRAWLDRFLQLPNGIPSHDTFGRVFSMLDAQQFQSCFSDWVQAVNVITKGQVIAIDGKTIRRSGDRHAGKSAIHMVNAWASANHLLLGQTRVDDRSNEITAIPELLRVLDVSGCIVTMDAMGCQKEIAANIIEEGADYLLAVKRNHPHLHDGIKDTFELARTNGFADVEHNYSQTVNKGHGRIETRRCWAVSDPHLLRYVDEANEWKGLSSIVMIESERVIDEGRSLETRYYISSLPNEAGRLLESARSHWTVENSAHWVLDVAFREDDSRVRVGNAAENFSTLRRMTLNMLKQEKSVKVGIAAKRKRAGWDTEYLLKVLSQ